MLLLSVGLFVGAFLYQQGKQVKAESQNNTTIKAKAYTYHPVVNLPQLERQGIVQSCIKSFQGFLSGQDVAAKSEFTYEPREGIPKMVKYYAESGKEILLSTPNLSGITCFQVAGKRVLCLLIKFEQQDETWELAFIENKEKPSASGGYEWDMDWEQFVRYQTSNWDSFLQGKGPNLGIFRVHAKRERAMDSKTHYAIRFTGAPNNGKTILGLPTPTVLVQKNTPLGKELYKYFKMKVHEDLPNKIFGQKEDSDAVRMRVELLRVDPDKPGQSPRFYLNHIIDPEWFGIPCTPMPGTIKTESDKEGVPAPTPA